jgi:hypothetical protein
MIGSYRLAKTLPPCYRLSRVSVPAIRRSARDGVGLGVSRPATSKSNAPSLYIGKIVWPRVARLPLTELCGDMDGRDLRPAKTVKSGAGHEPSL